MGNSVSGQLVLFGQSILLGAAAGVVYDLLRAFRRRWPRSTAALDSVYCLLLGGGLLLFALKRGAGELRLYALVGLLGGAVLFFSLFADLLRPVWDFWVDTVAYLVYLLLIPWKLVKKFCKKLAAAGKNLFYFAGKCYTIKQTGAKRFRRTGGAGYGKTENGKTQAGRHRTGGSPAAVAAASNPFAAVTPPSIIFI